MFKNAYQKGLFTVFNSSGSAPLLIWEPVIENGLIRRITDEDVKSNVIEILGNNVATTYLTAPKDPNQTLGISLPFLIMIVKNLRKYFSFEITILDDKLLRRRFRISNYQSSTKITTFSTSMPISLSAGWNQIQFNLVDFTKRAYDCGYVETLRIQVHANCRLKRIYFSDRLFDDSELPNDYKLFIPLDSKPTRGRKKAEEKAEKPAEPSREEKPTEIQEGAAAPEVSATDTIHTIKEKDEGDTKSIAVSEGRRSVGGMSVRYDENVEEVGANDYVGDGEQLETASTRKESVVSKKSEGGISAPSMKSEHGDESVVAGEGGEEAEGGADENKAENSPENAPENPPENAPENPPENAPENPPEEETNAGAGAVGNEPSAAPSTAAEPAVDGDAPEAATEEQAAAES